MAHTIPRGQPCSVHCKDDQPEMKTCDSVLLLWKGVGVGYMELASLTGCEWENDKLALWCFTSSPRLQAFLSVWWVKMVLSKVIGQGWCKRYKQSTNESQPVRRATHCLCICTYVHSMCGPGMVASVWQVHPIGSIPPERVCIMKIPVHRLFLYITGSG